MRFTRALAASSTLVVSLTMGLAARAQTSGQDAAAAQALFDDGKRLMQLGKYGEACPKLVESQRLDPGGGTRLAIALCHEGEGRTATAWSDFNLVLTDARHDHRADRETAAVEHIRALEKKLTRVTIAVASKVEGLEVRRDGAVLGEAQWSTPLPIDPGEHRFEARAPGRTPWESVVAVAGEGAVVEIRIPPLEPAAAAAVTPTPTPTTGTAPPLAANVSVAPGAPPPAGDTSSSRSTHMTWAAITGGVGVVATGVGIAFGVSASSQWSGAKRACPGGACANPGDVGRGSDAGRAADMATMFLVVGGLGVATAAVLFFTAPSSDARSTKLRVAPLVGQGTAGLTLGGSL